MKKICIIIFLNIFVINNAFSQNIDEKKKNHKGSFDLGINISNGNSKEETLESNFDLKYDFNKEISNLLKARAENKKQNRNRTREKYFVNNQLRENINKLNFKFLELEFVSDRHGGYNYRTSETIGIGRKLIDDKKYQVSIQGSIGLRQSKLINDQNNNHALARVGSNINIQINKTTSFEEYFDFSIDEDANIIRSHTNLKILLSKKLYFKFGVLIERVSNVEPGIKNSDVTTSLKLGYEF